MPEQSQTRVYPHAPISEASISFHFEGSTDDKQINKVVNRLKDPYPYSTPISSISIQIGPPLSPSQQSPRIAITQRLNTNDQADVVVVGPSTSTVARLAPYEGWSKLRERAKLVCHAWKNSSIDLKVKQIGIRYINRIDIPTPENDIFELQSYLNFFPHLPDLGNGPMQSFIIQTVVPTVDKNWVASLTSTLLNPPPLINHISLLLDIVVFSSVTIPASDDGLWEMIDAARAVKNDIFERCITDTTRELIS